MTFLLYSVVSLLLLYSTAKSVDTKYYPQFHLAPPYGWMNDPNGFSYFDGYYHLFYQFNPNSSDEPGIANWGHAKSKDFFNWIELPIAMAPDSSYDKTGVFSGSAIVVNDTMYLYYTGNVNHEGEVPDHEQHQAIAISTDGIHVTKYEGNPIIQGENRQPNFRDPKVWEHDGTYYMVLGNSFQNNDNVTLGRVLLYSSTDMYNWTEESILAESDGTLGYMFECPDFFELDGHWVLLFSPQGVKPEGFKYRNLYQTGYIIGDFCYKTKKFTPIAEFKELDHGHDFYATQSIEDINGDRVVVAWADMWENVYPERKTGFTGQMTIPRILRLNQELRLLQTPVRQIQAATGNVLYAGRARGDTVVRLENKTGKVEVRTSGCEDFSLIFEAEKKPLVTISYDNDLGLVTLDRGGEDGKRTTEWRPKGELHWTVYKDRSSIEAFLGEGEVTFTSRDFANGTVYVRIGERHRASFFAVQSMLQTVPAPPENL